MKELTKAYKCGYCSKVSLSKSAIKNHERNCRHNPVNKTYCYECVNSRNMEKVYTAYKDLSMEREKIANKAPFCASYDKYLIAPKLARKSWFKLEEDEMLMPVLVDKICPFFKDSTHKEPSDMYRDNVEIYLG